MIPSSISAHEKNQYRALSNFVYKKKVNRRSNFGLWGGETCLNSLLLELAVGQKVGNKNYMSETEPEMVQRSHLKQSETRLVRDSSLFTLNDLFWVWSCCDQPIRGFCHRSFRVNVNFQGRLSDELCAEGGVTITTVEHSGSGIWTPCLSKGPDIDDSSSSLLEVLT